MASKPKRAHLSTAEFQRLTDRAAEVRPFAWKPLRPVPLIPGVQARIDEYRALPSLTDRERK